MDTTINTIDIILITCNRLHLLKQTIRSLYSRLSTPFNLIVVDDESVDGTLDYLQALKRAGRIKVLISGEHRNICQAYNEGFKYVESEYFITMQDDIIIPLLKPDVIQRLISLMEKYPEYGGIGCRIQRIPNVNWNQPGPIVPARKALSAYFRIQKKSVIEKIGFGNRDWDDIAFVQLVRDKLSMKVGWAKDLWCDHLGYCKDRGYLVKPRKWGTGIHKRTTQDYVLKPYPYVDPITNEPI